MKVASEKDLVDRARGALAAVLGHVAAADDIMPGAAELAGLLMQERGEVKVMQAIEKTTATVTRLEPPVSDVRVVETALRAWVAPGFGGALQHGARVEDGNGCRWLQPLMRAARPVTFGGSGAVCAQGIVDDGGGEMLLLLGPVGQQVIGGFAVTSESRSEAFVIAAKPISIADAITRYGTSEILAGMVRVMPAHMPASVIVRALAALLEQQRAAAAAGPEAA